MTHSYIMLVYVCVTWLIRTPYVVTHSYTILIYVYVTWLILIPYSFICMWHDSCIYHTHSCVSDMTHSYIILMHVYVTWLIHTSYSFGVCDMTHSYIILIYVYATWPIYKSNVDFWKEAPHSEQDLFIFMWNDSFIPMTHPYLIREFIFSKNGQPIWTQFIHLYATWLIYTCVTWLIHMSYTVTHSYVLFSFTCMLISIWAR